MMRHKSFTMFKCLVLCSVFLFIAAMSGCSGDNGTTGASSGTVSGQITDTFIPANKVAGATVTPSPLPQGGAAATADASGNYSLALPVGTYTLTYTQNGYATQTQQVSVLAAQTTTLNVVLTPNAAAAVNVANARFANGTATLTANVAVFDPNLQGLPITYSWTDFAGNPVGTTKSVTVNQPNTATMKALVASLVTVRQSVYPPGHDPVADANDFDVPNFQPLDRFQVLAIPQKAFESAATPPYKVTVTIGGQTFSATPTASLAANTVPFVPNGGLRNVPVGQPVVLQGNLKFPNGVTPQTTWTWTITPPNGSTVTTLVDPATQYPHFIPDASGMYTINETGSGTTRTMTIYAGKYVGMLVPALPSNDPHGVLDSACAAAACHPGTTAFSTPYNNGVQFFDTTAINTVFTDWQKSGHSEIMVKGMSEGAHYSLTSCAKCHSVGYAQFSSAIKADGFKEISNGAGFTNSSFLSQFPAGTFFKGFDQVLRKSEIQCETCHGPNGGAHALGTADSISSRMSVSADVCGVCHGEPPRHGRFQEWRESGHGDFQTAMGEGVTGAAAGNNFLGTGPNLSCAGCHSGQGFPLWIGQLQSGLPLRNISSTVNKTALSFLRTNNVQPQTCATCHPVHNPGKEPGLVGDIVILRGDYQSGGAFDGTTPLLPSGFQANGVGKGALCITCHNSRNGGIGNTATLHEDGDLNFGRLTGYSAPHEACQGDVLMGRNSYYFSSFSTSRGREDLNLPAFTKVPQVGQRSRHSFLADACVTCHLQKAPTDPALGYPPGIDGAGTNHTFQIVTDKTRPAADQINALCSQCHSNFDGVGVQTTFDATYKQLLIAYQNAVLRIKFGSLAAVPANTNLTFIPGRTPQVSINGAVPVNLNTYLNTAPVATGTANTGPITAGFQRDLAKANWNVSLVAPKYNATVNGTGTSYDNGTPILSNLADPTTTVGVAGDQSKGVHNPSFVFNVMNVTINRLNAL